MSKRKWSELLNRAGISKELLGVLALKQGETDKILAGDNQQLLKTVLELTGKQETLERYSDEGGARKGAGRLRADDAETARRTAAPGSARAAVASTRQLEAGSRPAPADRRDRATARDPRPPGRRAGRRDQRRHRSRDARDDPLPDRAAGRRDRGQRTGEQEALGRRRKLQAMHGRAQARLTAASEALGSLGTATATRPARSPPPAPRSTSRRWSPLSRTRPGSNGNAMTRPPSRPARTRGRRARSGEAAATARDRPLPCAARRAGDRGDAARRAARRRSRPAARRGSARRARLGARRRRRPVRAGAPTRRVQPVQAADRARERQRGHGGDGVVSVRGVALDLGDAGSGRVPRGDRPARRHCPRRRRRPACPRADVRLAANT